MQTEPPLPPKPIYPSHFKYCIFSLQDEAASSKAAKKTEVSWLMRTSYISGFQDKGMIGGGAGAARAAAAGAAPDLDEREADIAAIQVSLSPHS